MRSALIVPVQKIISQALKILNAHAIARHALQVAFERGIESLHLAVVLWCAHPDQMMVDCIAV